jgi:hypothetical protein
MTDCTATYGPRCVHARAGRGLVPVFPMGSNPLRVSERRTPVTGTNAAPQAGNGARSVSASAATDGAEGGTSSPAVAAPCIDGDGSEA